jgi:tRNA nucleotidyltransferase (CCA-adding enzyme)
MSRGAVVDDPEVLLERFGRLSAARPLLEHLTNSTIDVHLVGGAVRDLMLGAEPRELDLLIDSELEPFVDALGAQSTVYDRFGTATIELEGFRYDVARARSEQYRDPGALPTVQAADLDQDLERRDFTVNAIALAVAGPGTGKLTAHAGAIADLRSGTLRVLHDSSFIDDPTRLLRLALYAGRLQFAVEPHTRALARAAIDGGALETVSGTRIGNELRALAAEADPIASLTALHELEIDAALAPRFGLRDPAPARRALGLLPKDGDRAVLALAAASVELSRDLRAELLERWAFEAVERDAIVEAAARSRPLATALAAATRPSEIAAAIGRARVETVGLAGGYGGAEAARCWLDRLRFVHLGISGHDLIAAGVPSGPAVGEGLRAALAAKLDGHANDRQAELAEALRVASADR